MVKPSKVYDGIKPICDHCGHTESDVSNSRANSGHVYRTRKCKACKKSFYTREVPRAKYLRMIKTIRLFNAQKKDLEKQFKIITHSIRPEPYETKD